ncbi:prolipoprotein diacylglyceryl transferase, partial [bacterium]|nr:prolipoprotein diacylglyceryl transferase [bacterium]
VGARLFHCFVFWDHYKAHPWQIFNVREGGLVFYGGFIAGSAAGLLYLRRKHLDLAQYSDIVAPTVALGLGFARIGCFLSGCCHGKACPASFPLGVTFPKETIGIAGIPLYPTQLAESFSSFAIFAILYFGVLPRKKFHGQVMALFLVLYGVMRSTLEFFRADPRGFLTLFQFSADAGRTADTATGLWKFLLVTEAVVETTPGQYAFQLSESQVVSLILFALAAVIFIWLPKRKPVDKIPASTPAPAKAAAVSAGKSGGGKKRKGKNRS